MNCRKFGEKIMGNDLEKTGVAIIGMAGYFPKADSIDEFWNNLLNGRDCITRKKKKIKSQDTVYAYGAVNKPFHFDNDFFDITPGNAKEIAPQERIMLEISYQALEDAGYMLDKYDGKIGIICGQPENEYRTKLVAAVGLRRGLGDMEYTGSSLASRVSYKLNLTGPSMITVAACATSMVAVHNACQMLLNYEADIMLAGGANIYSDQEKYLTMDNVLSKDSYCRAFSKDATGFVPANGAGMIALKRLDEAIEDNDQIYAIIRGSAIGNDGNRKVGFTAPSIIGEKEVIQEAMLYAGVTEKDFSYIETHGTGTTLGDAIELSALNDVFSSCRETGHKIAIGALKNNCGHMNIAAGIGGIIKTAYILKNKVVPPVIHVDEENEELQHSDVLFINKEPLKLESSDKPLIAGVSAFGFGGINSHMILEEYKEEKKGAEKGKSYLLPLSAKSEYSLQEIMKKYENWIKENKNYLSNASYSLFHNRRHYPYRGYIAVSSQGEVLCSETCLHENEKRRVIFRFSNETFQDTDKLIAFYNSNKIFQKYFNEFRNMVKQCSDNSYDMLYDAEHFSKKCFQTAGQYAFANTLCEYGIHVDAVLMEEESNLAMAVFAGKVRLDEAVYMLLEQVDIEQKLLSYEGKQTKIPVLTQASQIRTDEDIVVPVDFMRNTAMEKETDSRMEQEEFDFVRLLGELWKLGCTFQADIMFKEADKKKTALPSYCFDRKYLNILDGLYPENVGFELETDDFQYFKEVEKETDAILKVKRCRDYDGLSEAYNDMFVKSALAFLAKDRIETEKEYTLDQLVKQCQVIEEYVPYLKFLLKVLEKHACVKTDGKNYVFSNLCTEEEYNQTFENYKVKYPDFKEYISLVHMTTSKLNDVLTGKMPGNVIIYPNGNFDMITKVSQNTPPTSLKEEYIAMMPKVMERILEKSDRRLKILETGAGSGALSWVLMEYLKDKNVEYCFTDIGRSFLALAKDKAKKLGYKNIEFQQFNIEKDYEAEGIQKEKYDIVLSLDVYQATHNITDVLENLGHILKPGGWMISVQTLWLHDFTQLIYGYAPGWWNYAQDPLRSDKSIYVEYGIWEEAYRNAGFENISHITGGYNGERDEVSLMFAQKPDNEVEDDIPYSMKAVKAENAPEMKKQETVEEPHTSSNLGDEICEIIKNITGIDEVSLADDLFDAGVDSLSMLIVQTKIKAKFEVDLTLREIEECELVQEVVDKVQELLNEKTSDIESSLKMESNSVEKDKKKNPNDLFKMLH